MYRINISCIFESNDANNYCNGNSTTFIKDKAGFGGSFHLHRFASLLPTPSPIFFISTEHKKQRQMLRITHFIKWKELPNFPGYFISNNGLFKKGNVIKYPKVGKTYPYLYVFMDREGRSERQHIHRLVWDAFSDVPKQKGYHIHHKDFNKQNNHIDNLEYVTTMHHKELHREHNKVA